MPTYPGPESGTTAEVPDSQATYGPDTALLELTQADTLHLIDPHSLALIAPGTFWRDAAASEVFGAESTRAQTRVLEAAPAQPLTSNSLFQAFVLLLAAIYALLLYRHLEDICTLFSRVSRDRGAGERLSENTGGSGFSRFLNIATLIGILFAGLPVVKHGASLMPDRLAETLPLLAVPLLCLSVTLTCAALILFQLGVLQLIGAVTRSQAFVAQLIMLKRTYFALAMIVTAPLLLLFALSAPASGSLWLYIIITELVVSLILFLKESLNLFISKKISILHWFLYLCTVEVFPISLLWLLAVR